MSITCLDLRGAKTWDEKTSSNLTPNQAFKTFIEALSELGIKMLMTGNDKLIIYHGSDTVFSINEMHTYRGSEFGAAFYAYFNLNAVVVHKFNGKSLYYVYKIDIKQLFQDYRDNLQMELYDDKVKLGISPGNNSNLTTGMYFAYGKSNYVKAHGGQLALKDLTFKKYFSILDLISKGQLMNYFGIKRLDSRNNYNLSAAQEKHTNNERLLDENKHPLNIPR